MKALILAAGYGTRLQPFTTTFPKALFPIAGRPLLDLIITALRKAGCKAIIINTHHLHQSIDRFLAGQNYPIPIQTRYEPKILGTGGAIKNVTDFWDSAPFMVINSDIVTDIDLRVVYKYHLDHQWPATLVLHDYPRFNTVSVSPQGYIAKFDTRSRGLPSCHYAKLAFTGIQVLDPEILDFIPSARYSSSIDAFNKMIGAGRRIKAFTCANHYWRDIGTPRDYRQAVYDKLAPEAFSRAWPKFQPHPIDRVKLQGDGSDRKWYRLSARQKSLVMVDHGIRKGPETAAVDSFVAIGRHLHTAGLPVPDIYLDDSFSGLVFMKDLGDKNLQDVIRKTKHPKAIVNRYQSIIRLLLKLSVTGAKNFNPAWAYQSPTYDRELILEKECRYFVEAFLQQYLGWDITCDDLEDEFMALATKAVKLSINGFMHRDFQSRNIMIKNNQPYVIDFQGGRIGPAQYDLASLIIDPYVALPATMQKALLDYCIRILPRFGIAQKDKFQTGYYYCALTRNLQILGAFGYLSKIKKKKYFAKYIPRAVTALRNTLDWMGGDNFPRLAEIAQELPAKLI